MKSVVIVSDSASIIGGAEKVALTSAAGLAKRGYRVAVLSGTGTPDPLLEGVEVSVSPSVAPAGSMLQRLTSETWNESAERTCADLLAKFDPKDTIVHLHSFRQHLSSSILRPIFAGGFRTAYTMHEYAFACPYSGFFDYRRQRICPHRGAGLACLATNCIEGNYRHKLWTVWRNSVLPRRAGLKAKVREFLFVSEFSRRIVESYLPADARQHLVLNPIDAVDSGPAPVDKNPGFVFVGRLTADKDPLTLARAAQIAGVPVTFVGEGPLAEQVQAANPQAKLAGWLPSEEVKNVVRSSRALVLPSRWYETQGMVVLEAAAAGVPSIVSDVCAAQEFIEAGVTGMTFRSQDPNDLAARMTELCDPARAKAMGDAAYVRYWQQPLTMDRHLDRLEEVYDQMGASE